ncbi:hypothetical protein HZA33_00600 [Candidatus Pacearchaeota archaeon]|nr:hypothetical protein [Candidatus Pacearchaeota archaeon]
MVLVRYERIRWKVGEEASAYLDSLLSKLDLKPWKVQFKDESTFKAHLPGSCYEKDFKKGTDEYRLFLDDLKDHADYWDEDFNKEFEGHRTSYSYSFFTGLDASSKSLDFHWIDFRFNVSLDYCRAVKSVRIDAVLFDPIKHENLKDKRSEIENIAFKTALEINRKYNPKCKPGYYHDFQNGIIDLWGVQGWASLCCEGDLWYVTWPDKKKGEEKISSLVDASKLFASRTKRKLKKCQKEE